MESEKNRALLEAGIQAEIERLSKEIEQLNETVKPVAPDRAIGRLTRMETIQSQSISHANLRKAKQRLALLEKTLNRLDDEEFGLCRRCGREIPVQRLLLVPESAVCVRCASPR